MQRRQMLRLLGTGAALQLAAPTLSPLLFAKNSESRIPIAFSTLGCPAWEWKKILDFAREHGFSAIELRGLQGNMDLPSNPLFAPDRVAQTKAEISAAKLRIACVSSSANLYFEDPAKREKDLSDARRFIDLASTLGAPYVRVFGGKAQDDKNPAPDEQTKARVAAGLRELGKYSGPRSVTVIIESHDHFTASATLKDVLKAADSEHVGLLWDAHHTFATSNEDPEFTVKELGQWIRHTHLKDSTGSGEDRHYVLTGRGNVPVQRQIKALQGIGYKGYYCFEWEKVWHPDLLDPEIAIADYARVVGQCLGDARACGN
ncbi:MAG TPA: sugar phosphate isomerase/epimerase family protein [Candidatus Sulfotelmatobacter sp.]|nr:sugar phosphate isomerase/epimerase family protein [Candidatus Sulfotelmatobacter sp.]